MGVYLNTQVSLIGLIFFRGIMKNKTVFLIDGGFLIKKYKECYKNLPAAKDIVKIVKLLNTRFNYDSDILRIYFYDCAPLNIDIFTPVSKLKRSLKDSQEYNHRINLLNELKTTDFVSVREGVLKFREWTIRKKALPKIINGSPLVDKDFKPHIEQKGVDMKIGLDIAWISLQKISQRIFLITGDADFIPAMKFARRNGIQVFLSTLSHGVSAPLKEHSDVLITNSVDDIFNDSSTSS